MENKTMIDSALSSIGPIRATILNWYLFVSRVTPKKNGEPAQSVFLMASWIAFAWYPIALLVMDALRRLDLDQAVSRPVFLGAGIAAFVVGIVVASIGHRTALRLNLEQFPRMSFKGFATFMLIAFWAPALMMASIAFNVPAFAVAVHALTLAYFWATRRRPFASAPRSVLRRLGKSLPPTLDL